MSEHKPPDGLTIRKMIESYEQGASLRDVGREFGRSQFYVRTVLLNQGCRMRRSGHHVIRPDLDTEVMIAMHLNGMTFAEIARRLKCSPDIVSKRVRGVG